MSKKEQTFSLEELTLLANKVEEYKRVSDNKYTGMVGGITVDIKMYWFTNPHGRIHASMDGITIGDYAGSEVKGIYEMAKINHEQRLEAERKEQTAERREQAVKKARELLKEYA